MSKHSSPNTVLDTSTTLETGIEAFQSSPEFRGPVEPLDGHHCNDHFAQIYESDQERFEAAIPFVRHGIAQGERIMYVIDRSSEAEVKAALRDGGIDVDAATDSGALSFHTVQETYLRNGEFAPDEMIDFYGETVDEVTDEYAGLRIVAETTWLQDDTASVERFMEYESKVNELFAETDSLAICQYDRDGFPPEVIRNLVQSHPHLIYDGTVCHNVYYTPPAEFFADDAPAREVDRMLGTLRDRTTAKTELQHRDRFLRELYEITADATRGFDEKVQALFDLGRDLFDMELGAMARVNPETDRFEVECTSHDHEHFEPGLELELSETYCTAATDAGGPAEVTDPEQEGYDDIFVRREFGIQSYLGTHLTVSGDDNRTFFFVTSEPRDDPVTETERIALDLMGQWVEHELERQQREDFLRECYEITASQDRSFEEKLHDLFELGCEQFDIGFGFLNRVDTDADHLEIEYASDDHPDYKVGGELPLSETYCKAAVDIEAAADITDPVDDGFDDLYVYEEFGVDAYLGTYIPVAGDADRTLAFVPESTAETEFSEQDKAFIELLGQWIGYELNRRQREQFIRECYEITSDPTRGFEDKLHRLLDLACDRMDVEIGGLSHLPESDGEFLTEYAINYGGDGDGTVTADGSMWTDPSEGCYCRQAIDSDAPVGKANVHGTPWEDDEIHQDHDLACYLGTKVTSGSTPYGTLWVGDTEPRDREFTETERTLLELIGQWVSYEIERREHNQAQRELYEITSDPDRDFDEKVAALFELGCEQFGVDLGGMAVVDRDADTLEVEHVSGDHPSYEPGLEFPLGETFCATAVDSDEEVGIVDPGAAGCADRAVHSDHGFETYLGTHIEIDGARDRTFFFMAEEPRDHEFSDVERTFLDLMGQWVEYELERQQRERELRERTEHLNALIDTTPDCIKTVAPDGTLLQMNDAGLEMVEAPDASAVTGECVYDLIAPEDREQFTEFNERVCRGESGTLEFDIVGLEGTRRHMESHAAPLTRPDGETVHVAVTRDITDRKERQAELERAHDLLEQTQRIADVGGWELSPGSDDVFWTDHIFDLLDVSGDEEPPLDDALDMYHEDDQPIVEDAVEEALASGESFDVEARIQTDSDEVRWLRLQGVPKVVDGEVVVVRGAAQDITDRKEREQALRKSKNQLRALFDVLPVAVFVAEDDGEIVEWNDAAEEMWGGDVVESESVAEYAAYDGWWADTGEPVAPDEWAMARALRGEEVTDPDEIEIEGFDGERRTVLNYGMPVRGADGEVSRAVVTLVDITERKEREAELQQTKNRFETVFEQSDDGIFIIDPEADEFVDANPATAQMNGYTREELLSLSPSDLHPDEMEQFRAFLAEAREQGSAWTEDLHCRHKDGRDIPAEITASPITLDGRDLVLAMVRHIDERKTHEQYQRDLYEITADSGLGFEEKLERLLELGRERFGLENGYFNRIDADAHEFEVVAAVGPHDQIEPGAVDALDRTYCELHLSSTKPLAVPDAIEAGFDDLRAYTQYGLEAYFAATVHVGGTEYGTLCFASETPREQPFTEAEQSFLDLMGQCISYELEHHRRERFLRESYEITAAPDRDFDTKLEQLLDLARDWMGLDAAGLTHLPERDGPFLSEYAIGDGGDSDGVVTAADDVWTNPGEGCYCRQAIVADEPVGKADVRGTKWEDDPIHQEHGLTCYLGTRVTNGSTPYGTLWVGSSEPREREFTEIERAFLELIGQWVSYELERREHNDAQRELYEVTADADLATDEKLERLLELGCERLDLPVGMVNRDCDEAFAIEQMYGTHPQMDEGAVTPPESDHYCRDVIETGEAVIVTDAAAAGWEGDPLFDDLGIRTYAGVPVVVGGDTYGTLGFADTSPREQPFTEAEQSFLDLMGQCVGYELEQARREDRLQALSALGHELLDTETAEEVSECFVQATDHACNLPVAGVALYDEDMGDLSPTVATDAAEHLFATASVFDRPDGAAWQAFISGETTRITELDGESVDGHVSITDAVVHPLDTYGVLVFGTTDPYGFRDGDLEVVETGVANVRAALVRADREQELQEREDVLEEQNETLARLNRINDTIRSIDQALVEASTRDEIEQVVCEELAASGPYELAWIGDNDGTAGEVRPVESAGSEKGYLDTITITVEDEPEGNGPTGRAIKTGEPQVVNNVLTDESFEPWRQDALNRGYQATAAFPLMYDDTRYGVLNLYASEPGVFDDLEQDVLTELSNTIAHTINAIENRKALISDAVTELKFTLHDTELSTAHVMRDLECEMTVKRVVPQTNGGVRVFFTICGATADEVLEQEARLPITDLTVVSDSNRGADEATLFEATLTEESLTYTVIEHGGRLRRGEVTEDGNTQVVIHLGADADTREFVEMFKRKFPSAELEAKRTTERGEQSALEVVTALTEELTDRQLETLQTAYFSGYFEEPRTRTASEIADTMNIAQPTFNSHLRTGTRKIYRQLFENELSVE